jgi:hypothetical protein
MKSDSASGNHPHKLTGAVQASDEASVSALISALAWASLSPLPLQ